MTDEIAALASALRDVANEHPEMAEPIKRAAKNIAMLAKNPNDERLKRETAHIVASLLVALGKLPPSEMP